MKFKVGDTVFVKPNAEEKYTEESGVKREHKNFFGTITNVFSDGKEVISVNFGDVIDWYYYTEELCLASEIKNMTLAEVEKTFGVVVNATYLN